MSPDFSGPGLKTEVFGQALFRKKQKATEIDQQFDLGKEVLAFFDLAKIKKPNEAIKRINVDFPLWMLESLDAEANRLGVPRQSLIKVWIGERLEKPKKQRKKPSATGNWLKKANH